MFLLSGMNGSKCLFCMYIYLSIYCLFFVNMYLLLCIYIYNIYIYIIYNIYIYIYNYICLRINVTTDERTDRQNWPWVSFRASELNSVIVGSNPTQINFLFLLQRILQWWILYIYDIYYVYSIYLSLIYFVTKKIVWMICWFHFPFS